MSRNSTTRELTRQAANQLVEAGRRPQEITVDLIYAEIQQGSRTTINSELKLWKEEQARFDTLNAELPVELRAAMMAVWATALEQSEKAFEQRREEMDGELEAATERLQAAEAGLASEKAATADLRAQLVAREATIEALRGDLSDARAATEASHARARALEERLEASRLDAAERLAAAKADHEQQVAALRDAMRAQEKTFCTEIDKANERLEGVQNHVMLQVAEARDATRHVEGVLARAQQKNEALSSEVRQLGAALATQTQQAEQAQLELARVRRLADDLRAARDKLSQEFASLTGKCDAQASQVSSLEQRAREAETRLAEILERAVPGRNARKDESTPG